MLPWCQSRLDKIIVQYVNAGLSDKGFYFVLKQSIINFSGIQEICSKQICVLLHFTLM